VQYGISKIKKIISILHYLKPGKLLGVSEEFGRVSVILCQLAAGYSYNIKQGDFQPSPGSYGM
jgi:hypothetical protein